MNKLLLLLCIATLSASVQAQVSNYKLPKDLISFFQGNWSGKGEFFNGKPIEAKLSFELTLDSCWLRYEHHDEKPNVYHALSL